MNMFLRQLKVILYEYKYTTQYLKMLRYEK